jgi:hypothetical protein
MKSFTSRRFRDMYEELPQDVQVSCYASIQVVSA